MACEGRSAHAAAPQTAVKLSMKLSTLQRLLGRIYDLPQTHDVSEFVVTDRERLPEPARSGEADELVLVSQQDEALCLSLYLDPAVLERLAAADPLERLHAGNLSDYLTVLEGVSHFVCIAWHATHERPVTLLELELQAEIDKYVSSLWLLRRLEPGRFPSELHSILFERFRVSAELAGERAELYERANAYAARFCQRLAETFRRATSAAQAAALAELRRFYRLCGGQKLTYIERVA